MKLLKLLFLLLLFGAPVYSQGYRYDNFVVKPLAAGGLQAVSGALITVCTSAGSGTPCTPKVANIYSDEALTVPIVGTGGAGTTNSDANGNFGFYLVPGSYIVTVTGSGFTSYTIKLVAPVGLATNNTFSGSLTVSGTTTLSGNAVVGNWNGWLTVDGVKYTTIAAAVTAAGSVNRTIILIPSTYAGSECPAYQANLVLWDFRGGNIICNQINSITYNSNDASGVNSLARLIHPIQGTTLPSGGSPVAWYQETYLVNENFNNSQADGSSADLNFFGANSGTMPLASGHELAVAFFGTASGNASTGGTVTLATGAHGYVQTLAGSTTAVTTATGFDGIGCAGKITGAVPVNCYGLWGRRQLGAGSARNYGVASEGVGLFQYDSNVAKGGFDCEDNGGTVRPCLFVDATGFPGARGALNLQAVSTDGLVLQSSDGLNKITIVSGTTTTNKPTRFGADATPSTAAGAFLGGCGLPWAGLILGTGASNGYSFTPLSAGGCRTVNISDYGLTTPSIHLPATVALTADWTCGTGGTVSSCVAATIIGSGGGVPLTLTLPLVADSYTLECDGVVGQATAATANQWNLLTATNGATNVTANYSMATAATASAFGAVTDQASTTTTFNIAPTWTLGGTATKMPFHIWAKIEGASASGTVVSLQLVAPTVADLVTIYRGAACRVF